MNIPRTCPKGQEMIKHFEGLRLDAYVCPAGHLTIGWGHTGVGVFNGRTITEEQAEQYLQQDLRRAEKAVWNEVKELCLSSPRFSALVSFVFNLGEGRFRSSTLLKKLKAKEFDAVPEQFKRWVYWTDQKTGKKVVRAGLLARREAEARLWETGDWR